MRAVGHVARRPRAEDARRPRQGDRVAALRVRRRLQRGRLERGRLRRRAQAVAQARARRRPRHRLRVRADGVGEDVHDGGARRRIEGRRQRPRPLRPRGARRDGGGGRGMPSSRNRRLLRGVPRAGARPPQPAQPARGARGRQGARHRRRLREEPYLERRGHPRLRAPGRGAPRRRRHERERGVLALARDPAGGAVRRGRRGARARPPLARRPRRLRARGGRVVQGPADTSRGRRDQQEPALPEGVYPSDGQRLVAHALPRLEADAGAPRGVHRPREDGDDRDGLAGILRRRVHAQHAALRLARQGDLRPQAREPGAGSEGARGA